MPEEPDVEAGVVRDQDRVQYTYATDDQALAAFDLVRQNVTTDDPVNAFFQVQTGEVRSRGIELEATASYDWGLNLVASYAYVDTEITESNVPGEKGSRPTQDSEHVASLWADYTIPQGNLAGLGAGVGVQPTSAPPARAATEANAARRLRRALCGAREGVGTGADSIGVHAE